MHRQPLLSLLAQYEQAWPAETGVVRQISDLVTEHTDCFERTCFPGHITGSAWVVSHDGKRHLLLHHRKLNKWLQPGGHADGQAEVDQVAMREAEEESGLTHLQLVLECLPAGLLDVDVHRIPARYAADGQQTEPAHDHHDLRFLIRCSEEQEPVVSDESHDVRWFTEKQVRQQTDEVSVLRLLEKSARFI